MRRSGSIISFIALIAACTTISTPPPPAELPALSLEALRGQSVQITVLDQRAGERDSGWEERVRSDLTRVLTTAGVTVATDAQTHFEVRILQARSDAGRHVWNGCVELSGRIAGATSADASGAACVTRGTGTARDVLHLAYEDAMFRMLSTLDTKLGTVPRK
jgi:hypothetical protein